MFIEQRYGSNGVIGFLNSLGKAHSLDAAIEPGLGVKFDEFSQQWTAWICK